MTGSSGETTVTDGGRLGTDGTPAEAAGALVRETFRAMVERVEHVFDDTDLTLSQWLTLKLMGEGAIMCIGDVNRELGITSGAATRLVDQLEGRMFICRQRSTSDRRSVGISLTDEGRSVIRVMQPRMAGFWARQLSIFTPAERSLLFSLLARLRDDLRAAEHLAGARLPCSD